MSESWCCFGGWELGNVVLGVALLLRVCREHEMALSEEGCLVSACLEHFCDRVEIKDQ
jgi:hypothetical protein